MNYQLRCASIYISTYDILRIKKIKMKNKICVKLQIKLTHKASRQTNSTAKYYLTYDFRAIKKNKFKVLIISHVPKTGKHHLIGMVHNS